MIKPLRIFCSESFPVSYLDTQTAIAWIRRPGRRFVFGAAILLTFFLTAAGGRGESVPEKLELSRESAISMAIRKNVDLRIEALNTSMAEASLARSRGIYNPVLSSSVTSGETVFPGETFGTRSTVGTLGVTQYFPTGGSVSASTQSGYTTAESDVTGKTRDWQSSAGITISQPLLRNAGKETMELSISLAADNLQDSLERFRFFITDTVFAVITSYNRLYVLQKTMESRGAALNSAQALLDELTRKAKPGPFHSMEIANAEYAIAQRRRDLVDAERSLRDQETSLRYLIGMDAKRPIVSVDPPSREEPLETEAQALKAAMDFRPDLKQLRLALKSSRLQERVARRQMRPDLSVIASGGLSGTAGDVGESFQEMGKDGGSWYWSAGMQFSVPIGNTAAKNDYRLNKIRTEQIQNQITASSWKIRNDVEADMRALISARLQMQVDDKSLQFAEQRLAEYRKHSRSGASTVQDLLNAENDLTTARNAQMTSLENFSYAVLRLWRDTGVLLDRLKIRIDTSDPVKLTGGEKPAFPGEGTPGAASKGAMIAEAVKSGIKPGKLDKGTLANRERAAAPAKNTPRTGMYTLRCGEFQVESTLADARTKIRAAGLHPLVKEGPKRTESMIRLYVAEFPDEESTQKIMKKLRSAGAEGFVLRKKGKYELYAGSYRKQEGAAQEQKRLAALGIKVVLKKESLSVPTFMLTAGSFATRERALQEALKLEKRGLKAVVLKNG